MRKIQIISVFLVLGLIAGNIYQFYLNQELEKRLAQMETQTAQENLNRGSLEFAKLFIEKVLKNEQEVDFETRLKLENSVRELKNEAILSQWQKFTDSKNEEEAQKNVKELLSILISNLK